MHGFIRHFDVQGGGIDLVFPHHEMSAVQAAITARSPPASSCPVPSGTVPMMIGLSTTM